MTAVYQSYIPQTDTPHFWFSHWYIAHTSQELYIRALFRSSFNSGGHNLFFPQVAIMYLPLGILSSSLVLTIISSTMAQPVFRHKTIQLVHHHHLHPHHRLNSGLDVSEFDIQKVIQPILSSESSSSSMPISDDDTIIPTAAMPESHRVDD